MTVRLVRYGRSHIPSIAATRSAEQAKHPRYVAEIDGDQIGVTREQAIQLIKKGATHEAGLMPRKDSM